MHIRSVFSLARVSFMSLLTPNFITLAARVGYTDKEIRRGFSTRKRKAQITRNTYTHLHLRTFHKRKYVTVIYFKHNVTEKC